MSLVQTHVRRRMRQQRPTARNRRPTARNRRPRSQRVHNSVHRLPCHLRGRRAPRFSVGGSIFKAAVAAAAVVAAVAAVAAAAVARTEFISTAACRSTLAPFPARSGPSIDQAVCRSQPEHAACRRPATLCATAASGRQTGPSRAQRRHRGCPRNVVPPTAVGGASRCKSSSI